MLSQLSYPPSPINSGRVFTNFTLPRQAKKLR
jgi:hypothetical protein